MSKYKKDGYCICIKKIDNAKVGELFLIKKAKKSICGGRIETGDLYLIKKDNYYRICQDDNRTGYAETYFRPLDDIHQMSFNFGE